MKQSTRGRVRRLERKKKPVTKYFILCGNDPTQPGGQPCTCGRCEQARLHPENVIHLKWLDGDE